MRRVMLAIAAVLAFSMRAPDSTAVGQSALDELARLHTPGASFAIVRGDQVSLREHRSGAALPATAGKALGLVAHLAAKPAENKPAAMPVSPCA